MEKKIVSLRQIKFEKMYESFYKDIRNYNMSKSIFFKSDVISKNKAKIG